MSRTYDKLKKRRRADGSEEPPDLDSLDLFSYAKAKEKNQIAQPPPADPPPADPPPKKKPRPKKPKQAPPPPPPPPEEPEPVFGGPTQPIEPIEEPGEEAREVPSFSPAERRMGKTPAFEPPAEEELAGAESEVGAGTEEQQPVAAEDAMEFPPPEEETVRGGPASAEEETPPVEPGPVLEEQPMAPPAREELEPEGPLLQPGRPLRPGGISPLTGRLLPQTPPPSHSGILTGAAVVLVGALIIGALYGVVKGIAKAVAGRPARGQVARTVEPAPPASVLDFESAKPPAPRPAARPPRPPGTLSLSAPGANVTVEGRVHIVVFNKGLFEGGVKLSKEAERQLSKLAQQLAPHGKNASITVIGCTDNVKLSAKSRYRDNRELGLLRAGEVARFLQAEGGLPAGAFQTLSYGTQWSPYPNDTPENRARNRTAVLRVSLRK